MAAVVRAALCALLAGGALALGAAAPGARATQCTGSSSAGLADAECDAWVDLYDGTGGKNWTSCSDKRLDPCACSGSVTCSGSHITEM